MPASAPFPADVLVAFGITGDLARQMTFSARYRLERRGLLRCLVVGVAVDDWTIQISATTPAERSRLAGGNTPWCAPVGGQHR
jgi:glucose-6-phosphate 1-dehydrogenase